MIKSKRARDLENSKKEIFITSAKRIIANKGRCFGGIAISCDDCPANKSSGCDLSFKHEPQEKMDFFRNWLKENDTERPQFTEEQALKLCREHNDVCLVQGLGCEKTCAQTDKCLYRTLKEKDYIKKSELEILVEEAEDMIEQYFCDNKSVDITEVLDSALRAIRTMKTELSKQRK